MKKLSRTLKRKIKSTKLKEMYGVLETFYFEGKILHSKICKICSKKFNTPRINTNICSFACKQLRSLQRVKLFKKPDYLKNKIIPNRFFSIPKDMDMQKCILCKFRKTVDWHHYGDANKKIVPLCPNHHAMIHRKIFKLKIVEFSI